MAYTSILAVHRLERSVEYVTNKDKTVRPRPDSASSLQEAVDYTRVSASDKMKENAEEKM